MKVRSVAAGLALAGVVASGAQAATDIPLVRDQAAVAGCERLGEVKSASLLGGAMTNMAYSRALKKLKARAVKLGATHILMVDVSSGIGGSNMLGEAYRCAPKP